MPIVYDSNVEKSLVFKEDMYKYGGSLRSLESF